MQVAELFKDKTMISALNGTGGASASVVMPSFAMADFSDDSESEYEIEDLPTIEELQVEEEVTF